MESRSDSLAAELKRLGIFDDYFAYWLQARPSFVERQEWLEEKGVKASAGALHRLHRSPEAMDWRTAEAARAREALSRSLPRDINLQIRRSLLDQRFNATMGELSHAQLMDHLRVEKDTMDVQIKRDALDLKKKELALTREKHEVQTCAKFLEWYQDKRATAIAEGSGSNAEKIAALRQLYFADVEAMAESGAVKLPD